MPSFVQRRHLPLLALLLLYWALCVALLFSWQARGVNQPTGDEPWYLIMAAGIVEHGTLEQHVPIDAETSQPRIYADGLPSFDPATPLASHTIAGPRGYYSIHNIGLPVLLAAPFAVGGVIGAKLFLIALSGLMVVLAWRITQAELPSLTQRALATAAVCLGLPLLPAAAQVYPDIPGGLACLLGLYWLATWQSPRSAAHQWCYATVIAIAPWLQIRFAAPVLILIGALLWQAWRVRALNLPFARRLLVPLAISGVTLCGYNAWAFGNPLGPYSGDALAFNATALLTLVGLHLDQNQGLLLQNPVHVVGLAALGWLVLRRPALGLTTLLVYASLIVPNALHPNWYAGWSFSGRFGWAATIVLALPTLLGLARIARGAPWGFVALVAAILALQATFYAGYIGWTGDVDLYNRSDVTKTMPWLSAYPIFYSGFWSWVPAFYGEHTWAWQWPFIYLPNVAFLAAAIGAAAVGMVTARHSDVRFARVMGGWGVASLIVVVVAGTLQTQPVGYQQPVTWQAGPLPGHTGQPDGHDRVALPGRDAAGLVLFGASLRLGHAPHLASITYQSDAPPDARIGVLEVYHPGLDAIIHTFALPGTDGELRTERFALDADNGPSWHELRVLWDGTADVRVQSVAWELAP